MERRTESTTPSVIRSSDNPTIKLVRSLRQRKTREAERLFVIEGDRLVADMLSFGLHPKLVLVREDQFDKVSDVLCVAQEPLELRVVDRRLFDSLSDTVTPQGILAIVPYLELPEIETKRPLVVVVDSISDPGNLGTLLRVVAGAGATAVYLTDGTVDPYNPKVVRAGMGAHFRVPIRWLDDDAKTRFVSNMPTRVLADAGGELKYDDVDWTGPTVLLLGPETGGFSEEIAELATARARIPLQNTLESLNAAVAGAIMLFEASRQRRLLNHEGTSTPN
jgi:TrmH family RNA methyltransferase